MGTLVKVAIAILISLFFTSCAFDINFGDGIKGIGEVNIENRNLNENFTVIKASEGLDVFVTQADKYSVKVEAHENVIDYIVTEVHNGVLKIHTEKNIGNATKTIYVSLPEIDALDSSSGADLVAESSIKAEKIILNASSGSDIKATIYADEIEADTSSGASIRIEGKANVLVADASSGSNIRAKELIVEKCYADASSGADILVNVSKELTADASSGGDVRYNGDPKVHTKKSVSGSVHRN